MTPERIEALADTVDSKKLWRLSPLYDEGLSQTQRDRRDAGVALRRYASHVRDREDCLVRGQSLVVTPSLLSSARIDVQPAGVVLFSDGTWAIRQDDWPFSEENKPDVREGDAIVIAVPPGVLVVTILTKDVNGRLWLVGRP